MTAPSIDQAPPGYYMVFLVDNQGVPSVAPVVELDKTAGATPDPRVTQSSQSRPRHPRVERLGRRQDAGKRRDVRRHVLGIAALVAGRSRGQPRHRPPGGDAPLRLQHRARPLGLHLGHAVQFDHRLGSPGPVWRDRVPDADSVRQRRHGSDRHDRAIHPDPGSRHEHVAHPVRGRDGQPDGDRVEHGIDDHLPGRSGRSEQRGRRRSVFDHLHLRRDADRRRCRLRPDQRKPRDVHEQQCQRHRRHEPGRHGRHGQRGKLKSVCRHLPDQRRLRG